VAQPARRVDDEPPQPDDAGDEAVPRTDDEPTRGDEASIADREDLEEALLEGDRTITPGTARAALSYPVFRLVFVGALLSNIGSWMQNVVLNAYAYDVTGSATVVSLVTFGQLGPLLVLSLVGGALADIFDRRTLLIWVAIEQALFSLVLAWITVDAEPSLVAMFAAIVAIGIGQAVYAPTYSALIPTLVARRDLAGAVSLNSVNMNLSRVIGPAIGGVLYAKVGASAVFVGNALTYLFIIAALVRAKLPHVERSATGESTIQRMAGGFRVARQDRVVRRCLLTMVGFSFFSLVFVVEMPVLATESFGVPAKSAAYGLLYATFGLGAVIGALSIGTFLAGQDLAKIVRLGLGGFAVSLTAFALVRNPGPAYPLAIIVGFCYFATVTSLATVLQQRLDDEVRGRVMALWVMAFGGTVPIGALVAGPLIDLTSITVVTLAGAAVAGALVLYADLRPPTTEQPVTEPREPEPPTPAPSAR
jgi:predicted MFS family arabinose efflux permease